ncbi:cation diffusion zinc membrane transporter Zrg17 [Zalaria obscura]|uniref:Cation diffusion zinc membrane transporter Zrg17 n=1 Tax=Zalaria obscura TaxID=2024903 RepID=A0ACC3S2T9_9PEZI
MADETPLPIPPRTPSRGSDYDSDFHDFGLGIQGTAQRPSITRFDFDADPLSPLAATDDSRSDMLSPAFSVPPTPRGSLFTPITPQTPMNSASLTAPTEDETPRNPFNFTTQQYTAGRSNARQDMGKRRGHKYKHSSISHQIFLEPAPRAPLQLPASLPMPTRKEVQGSMTNDQRLRMTWCLCHFLVAAYVQWSAHGSLAMTALSRLLFFDAAGAVVCVVVDMMGDFEVWKRSSIKHPFGFVHIYLARVVQNALLLTVFRLERVDVLAGFGLAVFIGFMGLDVLSHGIQHSLENQGDHVPHSAHNHSRVSPGSVDLSALLAILSTLISAVLLKNHSRIGKAMRFKFNAGWGRILGNPSHFLTLSCSGLLLLLPLLSIQTYTWFDAVLSLVIALAMIFFGIRLGTSLASVLLMSYSGRGGSASVQDVIAEIESDATVSSVDEARFWQVHYGLCMANLKLRYRGGGYGDDLSRLRERVTSLVKNRLGGGYGGGGSKWEVSVQLALERD